MLLAITLLQTGCVNFRWTYGPKSNLWGGYEPDKTYILKRDVFVMVVDGGLAGKKPTLFPLYGEARLALVPEEDFQWPGKRGRQNSAPSSVEAFNRDPEGASRTALSGKNTTYSIEVFGVATNGTRLLLTHIERNRGLNWWFGTHDELTPFATILDGPLEGLAVDITDLSDCFQKDDRGPFMYRPVAQLLEPQP